MKPMTEAPHDKPFLARFKTVNDRAGTDHVTFCQIRQGRFAVRDEMTSDPTFPRWDVGAMVFFNDDQFLGWADLPEGFTNPNFDKA